MTPRHITTVRVIGTNARSPPVKDLNINKHETNTTPMVISIELSCWSRSILFMVILIEGRPEMTIFST
jgi:hypothetical protein